jgi:hypothetical protein
MFQKLKEFFMIKAKGNAGKEKAPTPKHVLVFKGIEGLIASGPGTKKKVNNAAAIHPEKNQGAKIPSPPSISTASEGQSLTQKSGGTVKPNGGVNVSSTIRPDPATKRDSAGVAKPN